MCRCLCLLRGVLQLLLRRLGRLRCLRLRLRNRGACLIHRLLDPGPHRVHSGVHHRLRLVCCTGHSALCLRDGRVDLSQYLLRRARRDLAALLGCSDGLASHLRHCSEGLPAYALHQVSCHGGRLLRLLLYLLSHARSRSSSP